jgi:hypothetical protein
LAVLVRPEFGLFRRFSMILRSRFVHCVPARTSPVAVHSRSSLRPGTSPPRSPRWCTRRALGVAEGHRERIGCSVGNTFRRRNFGARDLALVHVADAITPITKARLSPPLMADLLSTSTYLYAEPQDVVMTSILDDLVRGPALSIEPGLCRILDMDFPEFTTYRTSGE